MKNKIPKLRFKEFSDEWEEKRLENISTKINLKNKENKINEVLTNSATHGILAQTDYFDKDIANANNLEGYYIVNKNDFVYNPRISRYAPVGPINKNNLRVGVMSPLYTVFRFYNENLDFISKYFSSKFWHKYMKGIANYGARHDRMNITNSDFFKMPINLPSLQEQEKIANFLSRVDTKIEMLEKKKDLLSNYKKGIMQKLFSQKIRFKDENGNDYPKWEEKKLGDIFERVIRKNKENNQNVLTISAQRGLISQLDFFNKSVAGKSLTGYFLLEKGDFAYNKSYSKGYPVGAIKKLKFYEKGIVSSLYICFKPKINISDIFYEYYFENGELETQIKAIAQEGARNHGLLNISIVDFFEFIKINFPFLPEQEKIANFLSSIDKKLELVEGELDKNREFKKGLLQQMFV